MKSAKQWLAARGCLKAQLMVRGENAGAPGSYAALGYPVQDVFTPGRRFDDW
jgi:hypothetical protein